MREKYSKQLKNQAVTKREAGLNEKEKPEVHSCAQGIRRDSSFQVNPKRPLTRHRPMRLTPEP
jgi:hypothetical protein